MTNKEREAIERLNKDKNHPLACGDITIVNVNDLDTVLSLIKEQEQLIELMARAFKQDDIRSAEEIKQYFANQAKTD